MRYIHEGFRNAGTAVPVFSLRSEGSFGVGDFGDLQRMTDWVARTGQHILQILPINDTTSTHTWVDSYPYSAISIYALHPMYCDLRQLPALKDKAKAEEMEARRQQLNSLPQVDYEAVNHCKNEYLHLIFKQVSASVRRTKAYRFFLEETAHWLDGYVDFCCKRDQSDQPDYYRWVQYVLDQQMKATHAHAREVGVMLKGDIPIGVNRHGADVLLDPRYFNMNGQAGAPPDNFSVNGQNWGFPTYNWDEMLKDDCQWWVRRFQNMAKYFDAYRIDHVLGFFRIWEIPTHAVHGLLGQFQPALPLSKQEIEGYGLHLDEEFMTRPFIADWVVDRFFPGRSQWVKATFLSHLHDDIWQLKPEFDTQRKVEAWFQAHEGEKVDVDDAGSMLVDASLRDGLYTLISNVLFVRDHKRPELFHPRIAVQNDPVYETLWQHDKDNFNRLYNDFYYHRHNQFWYEEAMKKLPRLCDATEMICCAEDLGMVPDCVPWVMNQLQILTLELQSMPKDPACKFGYLERNPWRSVCTISSHDSATMRMWWDEDEKLTQEFWNTMLGYSGPAPHPMPGWLAADMVQRHLCCPSAFCIITLQDWLACSEQLRLPDANAERINIPANPRHYWRYRMHLTIEELLAADDFNEMILKMVKHGRRA